MCVWGGVREEGRALQAGEGGRGGGGVVGGGVVGGGVGTEGRRSGQVEALYGEAQTEAGGAGKVEALYGEYDLLGCRTTQGGQGVLRAHVCLRMESAVPSLSSNSYRPPSSSPLPSPPLVPQCRALPRLSLCGLHTPCPPSPPPSLPPVHTYHHIHFHAGVLANHLVPQLNEVRDVIDLQGGGRRGVRP